MEKEYGFDRIAREIFFPIYPVLAADILCMYGKKTGSCLDIGSGGGHLGLSVAKASEMDVTLLDINEKAIEIAKNRIADWNLTERATAVTADVHDIPFPENRFDVIVSRGSVGFWGDREAVKKAFAEVYRVLKPGGMTYIGRGFGSNALYEEILVKMKQCEPGWPNCLKKITNNLTKEDYAGILLEQNIPFSVIDDERGTWMVLTK